MIKLIKELETSAQSIEDLMEALDSSKNTILNVIEEMNTIIQPCFCTRKNNMIELYLEVQKTNIAYCINRILSKSVECKMVEAIFFETCQDIPELSEYLFISESSTKRFIKHFNEYFNQFDIEIKKSPLQIVGNEKYIRLFYFYLFKEKYTLYTLPFPEKEINEVKEFYLKEIKNTTLKGTLQHYYHFLSINLISLFRFKAGHKVPSNYQLAETDDLLEIVSERNKVFKGTVLQDHFIDNTYFSILDGAAPFQFTDKNIYLEFHQHHVTKFINSVEYLYNVTLPIDEYVGMVRKVYQVLYGTFDIPVGLMAIRNPYDAYMKNNDFYMQTYTNELKTTFEYWFEDTKQEKFSWIVNIISTGMNKYLQRAIEDAYKVVIDIFIDSDYDYATYVKRKLEKALNEQVEINILEDIRKYLPINTTPNPVHDLLVTNVFENVWTDPNRIICISNYLKKSDIQNVSDYIDALAEKRYKELLRRKLDNMISEEGFAFYRSSLHLDGEI